MTIDSLEVLLHRMMNRIRQSLELPAILSGTVAEVRVFLGTDRVKVYRFDADASGEVVAESVVTERLPSLLGQHFPAEDIPPEAPYTQAGARNPVDICYSGVYHLWYTIGMRTNDQLYAGALFLIVLSAVALFAGWLHLQPKFRPTLGWFKNNESRLNHHLAGLFGVSSLAWAGHLVHVAIPASRGIHVGWDNLLSVRPHPAGLLPFFTGNWAAYAQNPDTTKHVFNTSQGAGTAILTFLGGFHPQTQSLWLTDMAHHHLAIAVVFIVAGHMYRTNWGIGHSIKEMLDSKEFYGNKVEGPFNLPHQGLYETVNNSLHFQLSLALACLGVASSLTAQHMYSMPPYAFIAKDFTTMAALYTHHQYIAGFLMVGAFSHAAIFWIKDYDPEQNKGNVLDRMLQHKEAIISHLSWVSMFLGFHTLGLYVHNDVEVAFGAADKQILIEPVFAQFIQSAHGKILYGFNTLLSNPHSIASTAWPNHANVWLPGWLDAINNGTNSLFLTIGPGDFYVHHAIALGLHVTTLILVKGALDARGSKLMPDRTLVMLSPAMVLDVVVHAIFRLGIVPTSPYFGCSTPLVG
jgi:photosystem I P700 chlorophyll a apoprotein A2